MPVGVCEKMTKADVISEGVFLWYPSKPQQCALSVRMIKGMNVVRFQEAGDVIVHVCRGGADRTAGGKDETEEVYKPLRGF